MMVETSAQTGSDLAAELVERASGLVDLLAEAAPEAEALGKVSPRVMEALAEAELLSLGPPAEFGGHDVDIDTMFEVGYQLGRGCMSTAWCWQIWTLHSWFGGHLASVDAAREIFAGGASTVISSGYNPRGAVVEAADGGCMLSGRWMFSSGVDHADWVILGANLPDAERPAGALNLMLFVPREQVTINEDWDVFGLRGTGSKSVSIEKPVFVPESRFLDLYRAEEGPGFERYGRASYALPVDVAIGFVVVSPFVGAARAVLDDFVEETRGKTDSFTSARKAEQSHIQVRIGESAVEVDEALRMSRMATREMLGLARSGQSLSAEQRSRLRMASVYDVELARRSSTRLFEISGTAGMFEGSPMVRRFRDIQTGSKHFSFRWDELTESYGRVRVGLPPSSVIH
jgi:3-hydroxy-9,10-secoandrosta-1,3,5(10)-triene-9,17-dione monooxygenase